MNRIICFLIVIVFPAVVCGQMRNRFEITDAERYGFKGHVDEVKQYYYEPSFTSDSTYVLEYGGIIFPHSLNYKFNSDGYIETKKEYKPSSDSLRLSGIWNFSYDKLNRITDEQWILISRRGHRDTSCWSYEYVGDTLTNITKRYKFIGSYSERYYSYLQKGNKEIFTFANQDSSYIAKKLFVYDRKNRVVRFEDYENKEFLQDLKIYTYKDTLTRNVYKEVNVWTKYNDNNYYCYEYDENQNAVKRIKGGFNNDSTSENRYEYIYDNNGNWIEKKHFGWNGRLVDVYKRQITYY